MKQNESNPRTKELIKAAFFELYQKLPLSKIKVSDLIAQCAVSRGTFYFYYSDIYMLYHECEQDVLRLMERHIGNINLSTVQGKAAKHIKTYTEHLSGFIADKERTKCLLVGSECDSFRAALTEHVCQHYGASMEFSAEMPQKKRSYLVRFFACGLSDLICNWILEDCKTPAEELAEIVTEIMYYGAFPRPRGGS